MKDVISELNMEGYLVSDDFISNLPGDFNMKIFLSLLKEKIKDNSSIVVLNKDILLSILKNKKPLDFNWSEFDHSKTMFEKGKDGELYQAFIDLINYELDEKKRKQMDRIMDSIKKEGEVIVEEEDTDGGSVVVLRSYKEEAKKRSVEDFVGYFRRRFEALSSILKMRQELKEVISLSRLNGKRDGERICVIGMITNKRITKNENILVNIEDFTGVGNLVISKKKISLFNEGRDLCDDEIIGVIGIKNGGVIYVDDLIFPEVPITQGIKKYDEEVYCAFISDIHIGSRVFYVKEFETFIDWINGKYGDNLQKDIASKLRYLFIGGDLVEGVGIYPGQEKDLEIKDIYKQYNYFTEFIKKIPTHIKIIICPGNHDALRLTEPQPPIGKEYCEELYKLDNVYMVSNPALINIHSNKIFSGFDVLLYHGASFNYYIDNVESIRLNGGYKRADLIMQYLLKRRHLAPTHISTSYIPNSNNDYLVIDKVPDFLITGHIHRLSISNYKNVSLINASCWVGQTDFQEKVGLVPQPCKVVTVNLQTRDTKIINFIEDGSQ